MREGRGKWREGGTEWREGETEWREAETEWREGVSEQGRRVREIVKEGGFREKEPKAVKKEGRKEKENQ